MKKARSKFGMFEPLALLGHEMAAMSRNVVTHTAISQLLGRVVIPSGVVWSMQQMRALCVGIFYINESYMGASSRHKLSSVRILTLGG